MKAVLYARVSTDGQSVASQLEQLRPWAAARGWTVVGEFKDEVSGDPKRRRGDPPGLRAALREIETGRAKVLALFGADRVVRSPGALLDFVGRVQAMGGHVASFTDGGDLDTTTDHGELFTFLLGWRARVQLRLIRQSTLAGLKAARARGVKLGRPRVFTDEEIKRARELRAKGCSWGMIAGKLGKPAGARGGLHRAVGRS